jgi:hypothetical protein
MALNMMRLTIPLAFPEETTGADDEAYLVQREEEILPQKKHASYSDALTWAGSILQSKGWSAKEVTETLLKELPQSAKFTIGDLTSETRGYIEEKLRQEVLNYYPGTSARKRRSKK